MHDVVDIYFQGDVRKQGFKRGLWIPRLNREFGKYIFLACVV